MLAFVGWIFAFRAQSNVVFIFWNLTLFLFATSAIIKMANGRSWSGTGRLFGILVFVIALTLNSPY